MICHSGDYGIGTRPPYVVCDEFLQKGTYSRADLSDKVDGLMRGKHRPALMKPDGAVVWLPKGKDDYYIVTCTSCLRSFPVRSKTQAHHSEQHTRCIHCETVLSYFIEGGGADALAG